MSREVVLIGLLALAGFLLGGVFTTWKTAKGLAIVLIVLACLAGGGAIAWLAS